MIEPANPQVIYVPQYNSTTIYTQAPAPATVMVQSDNSAEVAAAGMIGFTAGRRHGRRVQQPLLLRPVRRARRRVHVQRCWDDYYDAREDAREDWTDHREDIVEERGDRAERHSGTANRPPGESQGHAIRNTRSSGPSVSRPGRRTALRQRSVSSERTDAGCDAANRRNSGTGEARGYSRGARSTNQGAAAPPSRTPSRDTRPANLNGRRASVAARAAAAAAARGAAADGVVERSRRRQGDRNSDRHAFEQLSPRMARCLLAAALTIGNLALPRSTAAPRILHERSRRPMMPSEN